MTFGISALPETVTRLRHAARGLALTFTIAAAATLLGEHYDAPVMLFALLIGMAFHFLSSEPRCAPGVEMASKRLLRIGVALLGARVTFEQILALGLAPLLLTLICVSATIGFGLLLARAFGRDWTFGMLTGGAVAICGASAALAFSAVLPRRETLERDTLFTVVAVTSLSTVAMVLYPIVFTAFGFDETQIGILIGATIHDVAQVVGAGYAVSPETGDTATYVKLLRVTMLPVAVLAVAFAVRRGQGEQAGAGLPLFAIAFALILVVNSLGLIPEPLREAMEATSRWLLVAAISALGMKTSLQAMFALGPGHIAIVALETLGLAVLAVLLLSIL